MRALLIAATNEPAPGSMQLGLTLVIVGAVFFAITLGAGRVLVAANRRRRAVPTDDAGQRSVLVARAPFVKSLTDLSQLVARQLTAEAVPVLAAEVADEGLHVLPIEFEGTPYALLLRLEDVRVTARLCDRAAANRPAAESRFPPLPSPATATLLARVDRAFRQSPAFEEVRWHTRERADAGDLGAGTHGPDGT